MSKKILVSLPIKIEQRHRDFLESQAKGFDVEFNYIDSDNLTIDDVKDVNCIIGSIRRKFIKSAENLEWLQIIYAGADLYTIPGLLKSQTILTNAAGAYNVEVSEHMLAMTFALVRRFGQYIKNQCHHTWKKMGNIKSVNHSTVLVLGLGRIGSDYAQKVKALGAHVIGVKRTLTNKPNFIDELYTIDKLDEIIGRADIIAMVLPGGDATKHIINAERLEKCKRGVYLINVGRGNAIDPSALKSALKNDLIGGAALDVTEPEPLPVDDELWNFDNVIITPHIAGQLYLDESLDFVIKIAGENIGHFLKGEPLINVVNRERGY